MPSLGKEYSRWEVEVYVAVSFITPLLMSRDVRVFFMMLLIQVGLNIDVLNYRELFRPCTVLAPVILKCFWLWNRCEDEREQALFHLQTLTTVEFTCFTNAYAKSSMLYQVKKNTLDHHLVQWLTSYFALLQVLIFPSPKSGTVPCSATVHLHVIGSLGETMLIQVSQMRTSLFINVQWLIMTLRSVRARVQFLKWFEFLSECWQVASLVSAIVRGTDIIIVECVFEPYNDFCCHMDDRFVGNRKSQCPETTGSIFGLFSSAWRKVHQSQTE